MVRINMGAFRGGPRGPRSPFFCEILRYLQRILNKIDTASLWLASLCCIFMLHLSGFPLPPLFFGSAPTYITCHQ